MLMDACIRDLEAPCNSTYTIQNEIPELDRKQRIERLSAGPRENIIDVFHMPGTPLRLRSPNLHRETTKPIGRDGPWYLVPEFV